MSAARYGHSEIVQLLLQSGAEIEEKSNVSGQQSRQTCLLSFVIEMVIKM